MNQALVAQVIDGSPGLESRIQLQQRLGPQKSFAQLIVDKFLNPLIFDGMEAGNKIRVVPYQSLMKIKDIHESPCSVFLEEFRP